MHGLSQYLIFWICGYLHIISTMKIIRPIMIFCSYSFCSNSFDAAYGGLFDYFGKIFHLFLKHFHRFSRVSINIAGQFSNSCSTIFLKHIHFSFKVLRNLRSNHNLTLICWKGLLSQHTLLFSLVKIKAQNYKLIKPNLGGLFRGSLWGG